jgi:hypothetical protein
MGRGEIRAPASSQQEIARHELDDADDLDLEVSDTVAVDVAAHSREVVGGATWSNVW